MDSAVLIATHISSLYPVEQTASVILPSATRSAPLAERSTSVDPPADHASQSSVFHTETTGTIILRLIDAGSTLELISLNTNVPPVRFVFPDRILPLPGIFLSPFQNIHILAITSAGSLYRIVLPAAGGLKWQPEQLKGKWCREYLVKHGSGKLEGLARAQSLHCVLLGQPNGVMLRLETEGVDDEEDTDAWTETTSQHSSIFSTLTSFMHNAMPEGAEFVSLATHPQPTENANVYTISRDRVLRVWSAKGGCIHTRTLPATPTTRATTPAPPDSAAAAASVLLDSGPQNLLRLFERFKDEYRGVIETFAFAFVPTPSSPSSGGFFHIFRSTDDHPASLLSIGCPPSTAYCQLQDFIFAGGTLYALWNRHGQSSMDAIPVHLESEERNCKIGMWQIAAFPDEPIVSPPYTDELLLTRGSLTDKLFEAIMTPGTFSPVTLESAIAEYAKELTSLPGDLPPQLTATYATVGERIAAVVGCTVSLTHDPLTGAQLFDKYWSALKRDWEGFIGRCNRIERSARLPLSLGVVGGHDHPIFVERERIGMPASEDAPTRLYRMLMVEAPTEPIYALLELMRKLRNGLGKPTMLAVESRVMDMVHEEVAFPFADNIREQARQLNVGAALDEGLSAWINGRLTGIADIDAAVRTALDVIGGFDKDVKHEEDEVELLLPPSNSVWTRALAAGYAAATVRARYDLCLSVVTLLFYLSEDLQEWQPTLLADILAVFRGIAILRYVAQQPTEDAGAAIRLDRATAADDIAARMQGLTMGRTRRPKAPPSGSLLHRLFTQDTGGTDPAVIAHRFLDSTGILASVSPAHATRMEAQFCEHLRLTGHFDATREVIAFLPRTPAITYVLARLWLDEGRVDDAADLFESVAGSFGPMSSLSAEDSDALSAVLPNGALYDSPFSYYADIATIFAKVFETYHEVHFNQLALSVAPADVDTSQLWISVIRGSLELTQYDDAYVALVAMPYPSLKEDSVRMLVNRMCEENAVERLITFNFAGLSDYVEEVLSFKARNSNPCDRPFYSRILYAWYAAKGDYRNGAFIMYKRARKLVALMGGAADPLELTKLACEAYVVAINALSMLDPKQAWFAYPISAEPEDRHSTKRRKLCRHIPEHRFSAASRDSEIIELATLQQEYALMSARLALLRHDPTLLSVGVVMLPPSSIISRLAHAKRFDTAFATARSLDVDMSDVFAYLTDQCLKLARNPDAVMQEDTSDWLLMDKVSSWPGTPAERGWRYLRHALESHDGPATEHRYSKAVLETILAHDRATEPPPWLITILEEHHPEFLIRAHIRYENIDYALDSALSHLRKVGTQLARYPPKTAMSTWLPYPLYDDVLALSKAQDKLSSTGRRLRDELDMELSNHIKRVQKLSKFSATSMT